ncbi:hypothetical protein L3X38_043083 [Prunus dulcis]|uniref:Uncharacterized protein n=1 Tax=Prunus dulcis TaxID=3755 RepID=A0AAD4UXG2_PRUDU|nr:hypothetical protein L3X38_043077 [Prunus dulcis]KAI5313907.1 hypothetical protein L3X38_043083 [Prunus dulcis]
MALVHNETMGDLDILTIPTSPSSIVLPAAARNYELKNIHFNTMPSFHGLSSEDPLTHIRDIFNMVSNMALTEGVTKEHIRMKCAHHGLPTLVLKRIFYKALTISSKAAVNNYAGGSIKNKTPTECQTLFDTLAIETQHSDTRGKRAGIYEIGSSNAFASKEQVDAITSKLDALLAMNGRAPTQEICSICAVPGHATISRPHGVDFPKFLQEQANMVNTYRRPVNDPFSNTYNFIIFNFHPSMPLLIINASNLNIEDNA